LALACDHLGAPNDIDSDEINSDAINSDAINSDDIGSDVIDSDVIDSDDVNSDAIASGHLKPAPQRTKCLKEQISKRSWYWVPDQLPSVRPASLITPGLKPAKHSRTWDTKSF
jgi:hypothetical protein